ncbi:hypothetical protein BHOIPH791_12620 [Bartonella henselae]|uniref:hypothetical protein n=1 Tax=Bartonella henselae TaxID=38323 RepID=UPI0002D27651|nr:hypothetical protein [Bartonella henselae]MDM9991451.1 hypothetical protein [Bartonella henselae]GFF02026.1 hypothetical protein BH623125_04600 [Bartonella henselae]GFF04434.1 hypothetical protein BH80429_12550 [Bartonella henselae]
MILSFKHKRLKTPCNTGTYNTGTTEQIITAHPKKLKRIFAALEVAIASND